MTATELNTTTVGKLKQSRFPEGCYSVEFSVDKPRPLYQFKLWKSESNPLFMVVKENSNILRKLKTGRILNMTYYVNDTKNPRKNMQTRIESINSEQIGRFQGHCTIELVLVNHQCLAN